jgi:molybdopterin synthase catalytic subunit
MHPHATPNLLGPGHPDAGHQIRVKGVEPENNRDWVRVTESPLRAEELTRWSTRPECGAVVTFSGTARASSSTGHDIIELEYETSTELAEARMREVVAVARERWPAIGSVVIHHRVGRVVLEEAAVVVVVSAPHRREAFEAAQFCIDTVKTSVPMWKREVWRGGSTWSQEAHDIVSARDA